MDKTVDNSSRFYHPGQSPPDRPWRRQDDLDRRKAFETLNAYVTKAGGWIVSLPADSPVVMECLEDSSLPDDLDRRGYRIGLPGTNTAARSAQK